MRVPLLAQRHVGLREETPELVVGDSRVVVTAHRADAPEGKDRPLVILTCGLGQDYRSYRRLIDDVVRQGFSVAVIHPSSYGTAFSGETGFIDAVADIHVAYWRHLLDNSDHGSVVLLDHSMGAAIDAASIRRAPELVDSVVQITPHGYPQAWSLPGWWLRSVLGATPRSVPEMIQSMALTATMSAWTDPVATSRTFWAVLLHDSREDLRAVAAAGTRVTVISGTSDWSKRSAVDYAKDAEAELVVVPGGHLVACYYPDSVRGVVGVRDAVRASLHETLWTAQQSGRTRSSAPAVHVEQARPALPQEPGIAPRIIAPAAGSGRPAGRAGSVPRPVRGPTASR